VSSTFLLYGANGYTGGLIAHEAVARGLCPVLAGRNGPAIERLARDLGCEARSFSLADHDPTATAAHLTDIGAVLNCAGPFAATAEPLMDACVAAGVHYLDITGEIDVIEAAARRDQQANGRGVVVMSAVGFDVVPTDCLAATLARRLPSATHLELAIATTGGLSQGTANTALAALPWGGRARRDGRIVRVPIAWKLKKIPFSDCARWATTVPLGEVASAYYSTGIPNIEVYLAAPRHAIRRLRSWRWLLPLLRIPAIKNLVRRQIVPEGGGPSEAQRHAARSTLWGSVRDNSGREVTATLDTLGGYTLTVHTALESVRRVLAGDVSPGFKTPSLAFGAEFILAMPETKLAI